MTPQDIGKAIDIHALLDNLERHGSLQDYYRLNHTTPQQRSRLQHCLVAALIPELRSLGIPIDHPDH
jgi:hypothetical protein